MAIPNTTSLDPGSNDLRGTMSLKQFVQQMIEFFDCFQHEACKSQVFTPQKMNTLPEKGPCQKQNSFPSSIFSGYVSFRGGVFQQKYHLRKVLLSI